MPILLIFYSRLLSINEESYKKNITLSMCAEHCNYYRIALSQSKWNLSSQFVSEARHDINHFGVLINQNFHKTVALLFPSCFSLISLNRGNLISTWFFFSHRKNSQRFITGENAIRVTIEVLFECTYGRQPAIKTTTSF